MFLTTPIPALPGSEVTLNGEPAELVDSDGRSMGLRGVGLAAYQTRMERPGAEFVPEGIFCHSTVASYCHVHFRASPGLAEALVAAARRCLTVVSLLPSGTEALCSIPGPTPLPHFLFHLSHNLNSLKGGYIGDNIGEYYRAY